MNKKIFLDKNENPYKPSKNIIKELEKFDVDSLKPYMSRTNKFKHIAEYPMVDYDLSLLFDVSVKWEAILNTIKKNVNNNLIHGIHFVDEYTGTQIPKNKKSITIRLLIGSFEKTLTSNEIKNCADTIIEQLKLSLDAECRD